MSARPPITWRVVRYDRPAPAEDPCFRGVGVLAVPGDVIRVQTPDGALEGEPADPLLVDASSFIMTGPDACLLHVSHSAIWLCAPWFGDADDVGTES